MNLKFIKKPVFIFGIILSWVVLSGFLNVTLKPTLEISNHPKIEHQGFIVVYDNRLKTPLYTYEILMPENLSQLASREQAFFQAEKSLNPIHRSISNDYLGSGYDRGHMIPAADQSFSQEAMNETFYLSNICPQNAHLNRNYWAKLEKDIRDIVRKGNIIEVLTGPLFLPYENGGKKYVKYEVIGKNNVAVPTHFFKLIKTHSNGSYLKVYIIPNIPIDEDIPLASFEFSLEELERLSGLSIINND